MSGQPVEDSVTPQRAITPPAHRTWAARGLTVPNFPAFTPKTLRVTNAGTLALVTWSCDGKRVAVCGTEKLARLWTPERSFEIRNTTALSNGHSEIVDSCAWNPINPDLLCTSSSRDMRVVFWDAKSKSPLQSLNLKPKQPVKLLYSPTGQHILVLAKNGQVTILGLQKRSDGKEEWFVTHEKLLVNGAEVDLVSCIWNHTGSAIIAGEKGGHLTYYSFPGLKRGTATGAHSNGASSIALDPRGKYIATAGADSIVNLFDIKSWRVSNTLDCTEDIINDIDFSFDGEYIAIAFARSLEIWSTETAECIHKVTQQCSPCKTVAWHPWKFVLAFGGLDSGGRAQAQGATLGFFGL